MKNILLCGVGGQGTVLASKILAKSAMERGETVHTAETIGMAQRGGSVVSHVRIGKDCSAPLIARGQADVILAFEAAEAVRNLSYLKDGGTVVVSSTAVKPVTDALSKTDYDVQVMLDYLARQSIRLIVVDGDALVEKCGSARVLNIALLGAAAKADTIGMTVEDIRHIVETTLAPKFQAMNLQALELGAAAAFAE
ncbi:MAG: indolepyruvate oxidoreductase subunit beta [Clostridia bacterium]|nr:indolepyruvate oxidoreductase subunit beta [Clostridia bacterium]